MLDINRTIAQELSVSPAQIESVIKLIDEGSTIPFIARYRKEATGGLDDAQLRTLEERLMYLRNLETRKAEVLNSIKEQGKLTEELRTSIEGATVMQRVEDLYKPFKKKRATRASKAREAGLEPLADLILTQARTGKSALETAAAFVDAEGGFATAEAALQGAKDIVAEVIADDAEHTAALRAFTKKTAAMAVEATDGDEKSVYEPYYDFSESAQRIPNHRVLAINRGEKEGKLRVRVRSDQDAAIGQLSRRIARRNGVFAEALDEAIADSYKRLIAPSLERELRSELTERAQVDAIRVFAKNTESLLQQRPVKGARIIALDPGYRTGCKVAVLDEFGKLLDYTTVYPTPPRRDIEGTKKTLDSLVKRHRINTIVIGNGTASRETEEVVSEFIAQSPAELRYTIVNEAGASVYSRVQARQRGIPRPRRHHARSHEPGSPPARPPGRTGEDSAPVNRRGAIPARPEPGRTRPCARRCGGARREPRRSGLEHRKRKSARLRFRHLARRREKHRRLPRGKRRLHRCRQLKNVPKLGPKAFLNCAGFLRISDGANPLDATSVHPESYAIATELLKRAGVKPSALAAGGVPDIAKRIGNVATLADELGCGVPTLRDIVAELEKPGRDPRDDAPEVVFSKSVTSLDDLNVGMELTGTVRNVVDFGAFVDIGA